MPPVSRLVSPSSTRCGGVKLLFLVPAPRVKPERQMKEMEHRSGTFFSELSVYASRIGIADRGAAVVAATSRQRRRRAPLWRVGPLFCVSVVERVLCASWLWAIHQQQRGFLQQQHTCYAAAAVMTTVVGGKRTLLPATGTPCRVSRRIHHTASSNVQLNHREHDDRSQTLQLEFSSRIFYVSAGFCPHVKKTFDP